MSFCFLFARLCPISLFLIILILIVCILSLYNVNINTHASESLQTSYDHYKCVAIDQNGLRTASKYVSNMCLYEFKEHVSNIRKTREQPRIFTNTNECKAITSRPLRFVTKLHRYNVCNTALTPERISYERAYKCYSPPIRRNMLLKFAKEAFPQHFRKQSQAICIDGKPFVAIVRRL